MWLKFSNNCLWSWNLSLIIVILFNVMPSVKMWIVEDDDILFENEPCKLKTGKQGICTRINDCSVFIDALKLGTISYSDFVRCSFSDDYEEVICCPHQKAEKENETKVENNINKDATNNTELKKAAEIEDEDETEDVDEDEDEDEDDDFSMSFNVVVPPIQLKPKKDVEKRRPSKVACERYGAIKPGQNVKYPHTASLVFESTYGPYIVCGATLISERFLLTAAHCLNETYRDSLIVVLGVTSLWPSPDEIKMKIKTQYVHQDYRSHSKYNDIALLQLKENVPLSSRIKPACLYTELEDQSSNLQLTVNSWGYVGDDKRVLLDNLVTTEPLKKCNATYMADGVDRAFIEGYNEGQYCANPVDEDDFHEDAGGPLQLLDNGNSIVIGISSHVSMQEHIIFVRVAYFLDWIEQIVWPAN